MLKNEFSHTHAVRIWLISTLNRYRRLTGKKRMMIHDDNTGLRDLLITTETTAIHREWTRHSAPLLLPGPDLTKATARFVIQLRRLICGISREEARVPNTLYRPEPLRVILRRMTQIAHKLRSELPW